ncbi:hypothetical protein ABBQ38_010893 [Trebouxia sp. C0009 RCD-2024]
MQLTISTHDDKVLTIEVDADTDVSTLQAILEAETGLSVDQQRLFHNGRPLPKTGSLQQAQVQDNDLLMLSPEQQARAQPQQQQAQQQQQQSQPQNSFARDGSLLNPQAFLSACLSNPAALSQLPPAIRDAVNVGDVDRLQQVLRQAHREREQQQTEAQLIRPGEDPMDMEVQARIAEYIRQKNVEENYETAMEFNPEVFAQVTMLYVNMDVNNNHMAAFIDSGAQSTIMSAKSAEECNLLRLMDTRYQGVAKGVGTSKILGRVHQAPLKVGSQHVSASITILEDDSMPFLFGLDMLRRYQCSIDLHKNVLRFGSINNAELPFLAEHELPVRLRRESGDAPAGKGVGVGALSGPALLPNAAPGGVTAVLNPTPATAPQRAAASAAAARAAGVASTSGPAQPSSGAHAASSPAATPASSAPGAAVQRLMGLGFGQQECQQALQMCNGNEDQAASFLFESSMGS